MRRTVLVLSALTIVFTVGLVAGCGGEEEATPTPDTITGTLTTDTTETETTETDTTGTDTGETTDTDHVRAKTVVTSINRISERPPTKEACLVVIYGSDLGRKFNLDAATLVLGRRAGGKEATYGEA